MHNFSDNSTEWPLNLPPDSQEKLRQIQSARMEATALWRGRHPASKQTQIPHRDFLTLLGVKMDPTILSRLLSEKGYPSGGAAAYILTLSQACQQWIISRALAQRSPDRPLIPQPWFADIESAALNAAAMEESGIQERGVAFLAGTGGGKTFLARWLKKRLGRAAIVEANGSWRTSQFAVLHSLLRALGQPVPQSTLKAESALLDYLTENKIFLILDEQDLLGRDALNLIRALLNKTRTTVIALMVPETWDRIVRGQTGGRKKEGSGDEYSAQLCRRFFSVSKAPSLRPSQAMEFLQEQMPTLSKADLQDTAAELARQANIFGGISLLDNCAVALAGLDLPEGKPLAELAGEVAAHYRKRNQTSLNITPATSAA